MKNIEHPLIVKCLDSFRGRDDIPYIIFEYADKGDLNKLLEESKIDNDEITNIIF